jgi:hypothetical protein
MQIDPRIKSIFCIWLNSRLKRAMNKKMKSEWSFPTWEEAEITQLMTARSLTMREKLQWLEQAGEVATRLQINRHRIRERKPESGITSVDW